MDCASRFIRVAVGQVHIAGIYRYYTWPAHSGMAPVETAATAPQAQLPDNQFFMEKNENENEKRLV